MNYNTNNISYVIDVESTCWENEQDQGNQPNEIIEIGVAVYDSTSGLVVDRDSIVILPRNSTVSKFCTELTGWKQEDLINSGYDIEDAYKYFMNKYKPTEDQIWYSCGQYDKNMLSSNTYKGVGSLYNIDEKDNPFDIMKHVNIKKEFAAKHKYKKEKGMAGMLRAINEKIDGKHHNGSDDAYNIAKIVKHVLGH